jgi:hypothetical protein
MPWFQVNSKWTLPFTSTLVDITSSVIINLKHRHQSIAVPICSSDVAITGSDAVNCKADSSSIFRNYGTLF